MRADPYCPEATARAHALQELVEHVEQRISATTGSLTPATPPESAAYLRARVATLEGIARRLRASPGFGG